MENQKTVSYEGYTNSVKWKTTEIFLQRLQNNIAPTLEKAQSRLKDGVKRNSRNLRLESNT